MGSTSNHDSMNDALLGAFKSSEPGLLDYNFADDYEYDDLDYDEDDYEGYEYDAELIDNDCNFSLAAKFDEMDLPPGVEATVPWLEKPASELPRVNKQKIVIEDEIDVKYKSFKQFDTVQDHSDHYFSRPELLKHIPTVKKVSKQYLMFFFFKV